MIQRIQSLYLLIAMILLIIVTTGSDLFSFVNETSRFTFSVFGITEYDSAGKVIEHSGYPIYIITILLVLLLFWTLMSYKNLKRQHKLGRFAFVLYFLLLIGLLVLTMIGDDLLNQEVTGREMEIGFLLFTCGFPFVFLANIGVKRDKKLLDSLNRLR